MWLWTSNSVVGKTTGSQMNIHRNAILYGSDITALFHVVGQTTRIMQCLFYAKWNPFTACGIYERVGKGKHTHMHAHRYCTFYYYWGHAI